MEILSVIKTRKDKECKDCPFFDSPPVWGSGDASARLILVGEYPREEEVRREEPFSQGFLQEKVIEYLKEANQSYSEVYLTHAVKCQIPEGMSKISKDVTQAISCCRSKICKEIERIDPEVVILAGDIPLRSVVERKGINTYRGAWHTKFINECKYKMMPTNSLMAAYRGKPGTEGIIKNDFKEVGKYFGVSGTKIVKTKFFVADTISKVKLLTQKIKNGGKIISVDIETTVWDREKDCVGGLGKKAALMYLEAELLCMSFAWAKGQSAVLPLEGFKRERIWTPKELKQVKKIIKEMFEKYDKIWNVHNAMFDIRLLYKWGIDIKKMNYQCSLLMQHLKNENEAADLGSLAVVYTDMGAYEQELNVKYKDGA